MECKKFDNVSRAGKTGDRGDIVHTVLSVSFGGDFEQPDIILIFENVRISLLFPLSLLTFINIVM